MTAFLNLLAANPLLLLFAVAAVGIPIGKLRFQGATLGFSAVLLAGMGFGLVDPRLRLPETMTNLGLAIFLYCLGLASAPGFFAAFRGGSALRQNLLSVGVLIATALAAILLGHVSGLGALQIAGLFSGVGTNTSSLAAVFDQGRALNMTAHLGDAAVAYALSFPAGILMPMAIFMAFQKLYRIDLRKEADSLPGFHPADQHLEAWTLRVTQAQAVGLTKGALIEATRIPVAMGRVLREGAYQVPTSKTRLEEGDLVVFVGIPQDLKRLVEFVGERSEIEIHRHGLAIYEDYVFFVSNASLIGRPLRELRLPSRHQAFISRIRRGDQELVPTGETRLELGDRVWVLAKRERRRVLTTIFGDSYRASSEGDYLTFSVGLMLGLLLGLMPIHLPGHITFRLGISGGALLAGLVLGRFTRIGTWVFAMPYSTSVVLRQLGLVVFFAGAGTVAGASLPHLTRHTVLTYVGLSALLAGFTSVAVLWWGYRRMKFSLNELGGLLAGTQTQSSLLDFATGQARNEIPAHSYAVVYPLAIVLKIILAQLFLLHPL